jgi:uncharacterized membrane protein
MFRWVFQFLLVLTLSLWVGSLVFFTAIVAPGVFAALDRPTAGKVLAQIFPKYYRGGAVCGAAALIVLTLLFLFDSGSRPLRFLQLTLVLLMMAATLYAGWILEPRVHQVRQERLQATGSAQREDAERRFQKLHARSVRLNLGVMALGVAGLGTLAARKKA